MAILPDALSAIQLADLNRQVDSLLAKIEANAAELGAEQLASNELHNGALGAKSNAGFCFGDITQRDPGKYEVRLPELDLYPPPPPPLSASLPWVPPPLLFPHHLQLAAVPWRAVVEEALGGEPSQPPELRSATVIVSAKQALITVRGALAPACTLRPVAVSDLPGGFAQGEESRSQAWHSDGTLPPEEYMHMAYAVVVYIPLRSVGAGGGRVEYLPRTHSQANSSQPRRVARNTEPWEPRWGVDIVTPPMDAGTAVVYDYTTQHRGLRSTEEGFRPVLKLDYFRKGVGTKKSKDQWCEENGFLGRRRP